MCVALCCRGSLDARTRDARERSDKECLEYVKGEGEEGGEEPDLLLRLRLQDVSLA